MKINCAEILAIHRAVFISLVSEATRSSPLVIGSDSANAILWCNNENGGPWNISFQLKFTCHAHNYVLNLIIVLKGRSSNSVADFLAKQGMRRNSEFLLFSVLFSGGLSDCILPFL